MNTQGYHTRPRKKKVTSHQGANQIDLNQYKKTKLLRDVPIVFSTYEGANVKHSFTVFACMAVVSLCCSVVANPKG